MFRFMKNRIKLPNFQTWDKTLGEVAQNWADKCVFEHGPTPMTAGIFDSYGQNLYVNSGIELVYSSFSQLGNSGNSGNYANIV